MDEAHYQRYLTWRTEALRQCRAAAEPPTRLDCHKAVDVAAIRARLGLQLSGRSVS